MIKDEKLMQVLEYINSYTDENGFPPTVRDMCRDLSIKSTATAYSYINRLKEKGHLEKAENKKRAVVVRNGGGSTVRVPLLGTVNAGLAILAVEQNEGYFPLPTAEFGGDDLFMLNVNGESMIEAGIYHGDKIVVRRQQTAQNGEIVVAMYADDVHEGATVKRFYREKDRIILHPENESMADIIPEDPSSVVILGKVVGLIRSFN